MAKAETWKERIGDVGIAGGLVAGMIGLLTGNLDAFVAAAIAMGGGAYLKRNEKS